MGMSSVSVIAENYFHSLSNQRTGKINKRAICAQIAVPVAVGVIFGLFGPIIENCSNAIVGISIIAALLCAMATLLFQTRSDLRISQKKVEEPFVTRKDVELVDQLFSAVMWAILFGLITVFVMVLFDWLAIMQSDIPLAQVFTGVIIACASHFVFVIGLILKRLNRVYDLFAKQKR